MGILKLGGIASGLDTDSLIKALMAVERKPVTLLEQKQEKLTTEQNAWRDLNSRLLNLQSRLADLKGLASSTWKAMKTSVSDQTVLSASADAGVAEGTFKVDVVSLAQATIWQSGTAHDANVDLGRDGNIRVFKPAGGGGDGELIDIDATDSLNDIAAKINTDSARLGGLTASVVKVSATEYRLVVSGKTGAANHFELQNDGADTTASYLQIDPGSAPAVKTAADGSVFVNSIAVAAESNSVEIAAGVTVTLAKAGSSSVTVSKDPQKAIDTVKGFVDQYNSVVDFINQQTSFDSKTKKAGALFGKGTVNSLESTLSRKVLDEVAALADGANALASIGITTEKFTSGGAVSGKLVFDTTKFTEKLKTDPEAVASIFNMNDGVNQGVAVRTHTWLEQYTKSKGFLPNQVSMIDDQLESIKDRIEQYDEVILPMREQRLRAQFTALEKAMTMFSNQGNWLSAQLSSLTSGQQQ